MVISCIFKKFNEDEDALVEGRMSAKLAKDEEQQQDPILQIGIYSVWIRLQ